VTVGWGCVRRWPFGLSTMRSAESREHCRTHPPPPYSEFREWGRPHGLQGRTLPRVTEGLSDTQGADREISHPGASVLWVPTLPTLSDGPVHTQPRSETFPTCSRRDVRAYRHGRNWPFQWSSSSPTTLSATRTSAPKSHHNQPRRLVYQDIALRIVSPAADPGEGSKVPCVRDARAGSRAQRFPWRDPQRRGTHLAPGSPMRPDLRRRMPYELDAPPPIRNGRAHGAP
jgi:hypothetical protein